ncbi:MAG TPA: cyclopropane-fatty-acyl-phospholipid synthase family protein [Mycobacteriales bacterium]|nr:cyclopropane-fatty-acyl-phospholipid synthase family protein [Mycobacteriales bacterium]
MHATLTGVPPADLQRWPAMAPPRQAPVRAAVAERLLRRVADRTGVHVELPDGTSYGPGDGPLMTVRRPAELFTRLGRAGKVGFGEAYMAGDWDAPDLVAVLEPMAREVRSLVPPRLQFLRRVFDARHPRGEDNDRRGARRNIARHYDLSNELFALFLDETMTYSSALFGSDDETLEQAQARKIDRLLDAVGVGARTRLLEIGTGWGELALRAARRGADVTTVTLSEEQASLARARVRAERLDPHVDVRVQDYRDVDGRYDAVVSVEMIEAVGERWWSTFFRRLDDRLLDGGRVGLQAILMPHDRLLASKSSWTWIHKYIFPGGLIPSEEAIDEVLARDTTLRVRDRLRFGSSYARTLRTWRENFTRNARQVDELGFDHVFRRMWTFYLGYCEAGFRAGYLDVGQLVLDRRPEIEPSSAAAASSGVGAVPPAEAGSHHASPAAGRSG